MITKARAEWCITHHPACDCREYKHEQMEASMGAIRNWADVGNLGLSYHGLVDALKQIKNEAQKALEG